MKKICRFHCLTPDPNSLQGKILRLLDATENDIVNLSQKELAIRLKASQQLISHHLRTLEKFGWSREKRLACDIDTNSLEKQSFC